MKKLSILLLLPALHACNSSYDAADWAHEIERVYGIPQEAIFDKCGRENVHCDYDWGAYTLTTYTSLELDTYIASGYRGQYSEQAVVRVEHKVNEATQSGVEPAFTLKVSGSPAINTSGQTISPSIQISPSVFDKYDTFWSTSKPLALNNYGSSDSFILTLVDLESIQKNCLKPYSTLEVTVEEGKTTIWYPKMDDAAICEFWDAAYVFQGNAFGW